MVPRMRAHRCSIACNSSSAVDVVPLIASHRCLVALTMRSVDDTDGTGKVWCKNLNVSVILTAPVSVTTFMQQ